MSRAGCHNSDRLARAFAGEGLLISNERTSGHGEGWGEAHAAEGGARGEIPP